VRQGRLATVKDVKHVIYLTCYQNHDDLVSEANYLVSAITFVISLTVHVLSYEREHCYVYNSVIAYYGD
jgi:hypothetical protein